MAQNGIEQGTTPEAGHPVLGAIFLTILAGLACGVAWDYLGTNAIQRARATAGCVQTSQSARTEVHQLPNMPSLTDPTGAGTHANVHIVYAASFSCDEPGLSARRIDVDVYDDARGSMRADGSIQIERDIGDEEGLASLNWSKRG